MANRSSFAFGVVGLGVAAFPLGFLAHVAVRTAAPGSLRYFFGWICYLLMVGAFLGACQLLEKCGESSRTLCKCFLIVVFAFPIVRWGASWHQASQIRQAFEGHLEGFVVVNCDSLDARGTVESPGAHGLVQPRNWGKPYRTGGIVVIDAATSKLSQTHFLLRDDVRADSPDEVGTVVLEDSSYSSIQLTIIDYVNRIITGCESVGGASRPVAARGNGYVIYSVHSSQGPARPWAGWYLNDLPSGPENPRTFDAVVEGVEYESDSWAAVTLGAPPGELSPQPTKLRIVNMPKDSLSLARELVGKRLVGNSTHVLLDGVQLGERIGIAALRLFPPYDGVVTPEGPGEPCKLPDESLSQMIISPTRPKTIQGALTQCRHESIAEKRLAVEFFATVAPERAWRGSVVESLIGTAYRTAPLRDEALLALENWVSEEELPEFERILPIFRSSTNNGRVARLICRVNKDRAVAIMAKCVTSDPRDFQFAHQLVSELGTQSCSMLLRFAFRGDALAAHFAHLHLTEFAQQNSEIKDVILSTCVAEWKSLESLDSVLKLLASLDRSDEYCEQLADCISAGLRTGDQLALDAAVVWATETNIPNLRLFLDSENLAIKQRARKALAATGEAEAAQLLANDLLGGTTTYVDEDFECLVSIGATAESAVWVLLESPSDSIRAAGWNILGEIGTQRSTTLEPHFLDPSEEVQAAAITALEKIRKSGRTSSALELPDLTLLRRWTSANGKFSISGAFADYKNGRTQIKTLDGRELWVPIGDLSDVDREYVRSQLKIRKNKTSR